MTQNTTSREERFDDEFVDDSNWAVEMNEEEPHQVTPKKVKAFIQSEFNSLLDELLSEVTANKKYPTEDQEHEADYDFGYDQALEDVRAIINHKKI